WLASDFVVRRGDGCLLTLTKFSLYCILGGCSFSITLSLFSSLYAYRVSVFFFL
ncbi:hypothetical protein L9F63_016249, partial [Diploptera punctata]